MSDDEWRDITVMERVLWRRYRDGVGLQSLLRVHVNILEPRKIRTSNTTLERFKRKEQVKTVLKMETFLYLQTKLEPGGSFVICTWNTKIRRRQLKRR